MSFHVAACAGLDETIPCKTMTLGVTICFYNNVPSLSRKVFFFFHRGKLYVDTPFNLTIDHPTI